MSIIGNVDLYDNGVVEGWIADTEDTDATCIAIAKNNGNIICEAPASNYREDLKLNHIGSGYHGFKLKIPNLFENDTLIDIIDEKTGHLINGSPILIGGKNVSSKNMHPLILFDVSDLIFYLEHHDHPTGIQRVVIGIFRALISNSLYPLNRIQPIIFDQTKCIFMYFDIIKLCSIIDDSEKDISQRSYKRCGTERICLFDRVNGEKLIIKEGNNTVLLMLGAAWVYDNYFLEIKQLKKLGVKFVPLIHDLIPIICPNLCHKGTAKVFSDFIRQIFVYSDLMLSVSRNTQKDLTTYADTNRCSCPEIKVIKNGQDRINRESTQTISILEDKYVLYVSTLEGRKNHSFAVTAWEKLIKKHEQIPKLVFVGRGGWCVRELFEKLEKTEYLNSTVLIYSDVSDNELYSLYSNALFTIYPSCYEGWGLPVGESLAFGKVCLASNSSSLPEVGGELVSYFQANNIEDFCRQAEILIFDDKYRQSLEEKIQNNFIPFSWCDVAHNVLDGIKDITKYPSKQHIANLQAGCYSFARLPEISEDVVDFETIRRHYNSLITNKKITIQNYYITEQILDGGIWYAREDWGRWGHANGNSICFTVQGTSQYILFLKLCFPFGLSPICIEFESNGTLKDVLNLINEKEIIKLNIDKYCKNNIVNITINIKNIQQNAQVDPRKLGIGFCEMALLESNDLLGRIEILENFYYRNIQL